MPAKTENYNLPYPLDTDLISTLPDVLHDQAQRIEELLSSFDFDGADTDRIVGRVTTLESAMTGLNERLNTVQKTIAERLAPVPVFYQKTTSQAISTNNYVKLDTFVRQTPSNDLVSYSGGMFTIKENAVVCVTVRTNVGTRNQSFATSDRLFQTIALNYRGGSSFTPLDRQTAGNEDVVTSVWTGPVSANDTLCATLYTTKALAGVTSSWWMTVQRTSA